MDWRLSRFFKRGTTKRSWLLIFCPVTHSSLCWPVLSLNSLELNLNQSFLAIRIGCSGVHAIFSRYFALISQSFPLYSLFIVFTTLTLLPSYDVTSSPFLMSEIGTHGPWIYVVGVKHMLSIL